MPESQFTAVWDALSPETRWGFLQHPSRPLAVEHVDELVSAGGRPAHALWLDSRPGHPRQWATSWEFRRFVERHRETEDDHRSPRDGFWFGRSGGRGRLPMTPG